MKERLPFPILLVLISFASVNAVLFTPALPAIASFFSISQEDAQQSITWFLVGYAVGQLLYGPITNRFGGKVALYAGISLQIVSSLVCVLAGTLGEYWVLIFARFFLALGSGVGLKMTFTLVNQCYEPKIASQKISYLMLAFAIAPGLGVAIGGVLNAYYGWESCFYAGAIYGLILLMLVSRLPQYQTSLDTNALKIKQLVGAYATQFKNISLITGGMLMGAATGFVYVFAAAAPFIAINLYGMTSTEYGTSNILPSIGLALGSVFGARLAKRFSLKSIMMGGVFVSAIGSILMLIAILIDLPILFSIFLPMTIIYFGLCFIMANASTIAMAGVTDKANGSAVMNFINMGLATLVVLSLGLFPMSILMLPAVYIFLCIVMLVAWRRHINSNIFATMR